jgi:hypothetical protein
VCSSDLIDLATASVPDSKADALLALADYYALVRFSRTLATRGDINGRQTIGPRAQIVQHVRDLLADAKEACTANGYPVSGQSTWEFGRLTLDYVEPEEFS